jgi:hypothetical protein
MRHIRQKIDLTARGEIAYTVVNTEGWNLPLEEHPSIVQHPELFEISENELPENYQTLNYQ